MIAERPRFAWVFCILENMGVEARDCQLQLICAFCVYAQL